MQSSPIKVRSESSWDRLTHGASELHRKATDKLIGGIDKVTLRLLSTDTNDPEADRIRQDIADRSAQRGGAHGRSVTTTQSSVTPPRYPAPQAPSPSYTPAPKPSDYTVQPLSPSFAQSRYAPGPSSAPPASSAAPSPLRSAPSHPYSHSSSSSSSYSPSISMAKPASSSSSSISSSSSTCDYLGALRRPEMAAVLKTVGDKYLQCMELPNHYRQSMSPSDYYRQCADLPGYQLGCETLANAVDAAFEQQNEILWVRFAELLALHLLRVAHDQMKPMAAIKADEWFKKAAKVLKPIDSHYADELLQNGKKCTEISNEIRRGIRPKLIYHVNI